MKLQLTPFQEELEARIRAYYKKCIIDSTVGVGFQTLFGAVCGGNIHSLRGAPAGTNGAYYFKEELRATISRMEKKCQLFVMD